MWHRAIKRKIVLSYLRQYDDAMDRGVAFTICRGIVFTVKSDLLALLGKMSCEFKRNFSGLTDLLCRQMVWASVTGWRRGQRTHGGTGGRLVDLGFNEDVGRVHSPS